MALLQIECTFEKIDEEGYVCKKEVEDTVNIDLLSTAYTFCKKDNDIYITPQDTGIFEPVWKYADKEKYGAELRVHLMKGRKKHSVSVELDVFDKETKESFYFTPYSPELTEDEYRYFYSILKEKFPDIEWLDMEESMERGIKGFLNDENLDTYIDRETRDLLAEAIIATVDRSRLCKEGYAEYDCDIVSDMAKEKIKEGLRLIAGKGQ